MAEQQEEKKKWSTPRGPAATKAKNAYNRKNYDRMELTVPKGMKAKLDEIITEQGFASRNEYIAVAVQEKYLNDTGKELIWEKTEG